MKRKENKLPHIIPNDFQKALNSSSGIQSAWDKITLLARNEWICWIISVKKEETRENHIRRAVTEIKAGKRRPCCWGGCVHR